MLFALFFCCCTRILISNLHFSYRKQQKLMLKNGILGEEKNKFHWSDCWMIFLFFINTCSIYIFFLYLISSIFVCVYDCICLHSLMYLSISIPNFFLFFCVKLNENQWYMCRCLYVSTHHIYIKNWEKKHTIEHQAMVNTEISCYEWFQWKISKEIIVGWRFMLL